MTRNFFRLSFTIILVSCTALVFGQESLSNFSENFEYSKESLNGPTTHSENTTWLQLGSDDLAKIRTIQAPLVTWSVLLPGEGQVELTLLESCPFSEYIPVGQRIDDGSGGVKVNERDFKTDLKTFDITGPGIGGSMVIFKHQILASIRYNNRLFELRPIDVKNSAGDYILFDVNDSRGDSHFSCAADDIAQEKVDKIKS
ncbi:MAG: hypothetical protein ACKVKI_05620, partial [Flavobacteriales bacterium]